MTEQQTDSPGQKRVSVIPYAFFVPLLVVMAQSAWVVRGWNFRHNALLAKVSEPAVLGGMLVMATISFFVILPFAKRASTRWVAFLACVVVFTVMIELSLPHLAE